MRNISISLVVFYCLLLCISCGEYEVLEFQKECKRIADSTYKADVKTIVAIADSTCKVNYDVYYKSATDSLIPARVEELEKLFGR